MAARQYPCLVWDAWSKGTKCDVVAASFDNAYALTFFLRKNIAKDAPFFCFEIITRGAQLVEDAAWNERRSGELRGRVLKFLSRPLAMILKNTDVLKAAFAFRMLNALGHQAQKLFDLYVACIPVMAIMSWVFDQNFMRSHRPHPIIKAIAAPERLPFDVIKSIRMHNGTPRSCVTLRPGKGGDNLRGLGGRTAKA